MPLGHQDVKIDNFFLKSAIPLFGSLTFLILEHRLIWQSQKDLSFSVCSSAWFNSSLLLSIVSQTSKSVAVFGKNALQCAV